MKKISTLFSFAFLTCFVMAAMVTVSKAQQRGHEEARVSPNAAVSQTIGTTNITVTYGRPGMNGREIFGGLVPYGEVWRTGANETTNITFPTDVTVEGEPLEAGTYAIHTIPGQDEWTVIFNSKLAWGIPYDDSTDVLRVQTTPEEAAATMEQFMIYFQDVTDTSAELVFHWDQTKVPVAIAL